MPITQDRFITVIRAAEAAIARVRAVQAQLGNYNTIITNLNALRDHLADSPPAQEIISQTMLTLNHLHEALHADAISFGEACGYVFKEREYFRTAAARNVRAQGYRKLRAEGVFTGEGPPPRNLAPRPPQIPLAASPTMALLDEPQAPPLPAEPEWKVDYIKLERDAEDLRRRKRLGQLTPEELEAEERAARVQMDLAKDLVEKAKLSTRFNRPASAYDNTVVSSTVPSTLDLLKPDLDPEQDPL